MKYLLHTTTMAMRRALLENEERSFVLKDIKIDDFLAPTIAINEDTNELYEVDYQPMLDTLKEFDAGMMDMENTTYHKKWASIKGEEATRNRVSGFYDTYQWIKEAGLKTPVAVECTGQKLDGSHRAAIMKHLGHTTIPAREYTFHREEVSDLFIRNTVIAREKLFGKNYYYVEYNGFPNLQGEVPEVYKENAEKWEVLRGIIQPVGKYILDIGCNEGYISVECAKTANYVTGFDHEFIEGANFHKLATEFYINRSLPVDFIEFDITKVDRTGPKHDVALMLCVLYHIPQDKQIELLRKMHDWTESIVLQGNLRKAHEVDHFRGCTVDTMSRLLETAGWKVDKVIEWRDKPIVVAV